jgi:hypothetical protein
MPKITPFTDNLIFFDTEFSSLEYEGSTLLSFGAVKMNGAELYCEIEISEGAVVSDWVREHVLPLLTGQKISMNDARQKITDFIGNDNPFLVTYVYKYDAYHWYKLFGSNDGITHRIILDVASMLFAVGTNPEDMSADSRDGFLRKLGIDGSAYPKHNALSDAKILRDAFVAMTKK